MEISPLYKILIYLEDKGYASDAEIKDFGVAVSRGVLGKMESMLLIEKEKISSSTNYRLSKRGYEFLNLILDQIHQEIQHWDNKWRFIWFSIPETSRSKRDKFRRFLMSLGLKPILNSLWITPLDISRQITNYVSANDLNNSTIFVETAEIKGLSLEKILETWDFEKYRKLYEEFIIKAESLLGSKQKNNFDIKKLIFEYASIINCEPRLPIELMPKDWPKFRADLYYKRLKRNLV